MKCDGALVGILDFNFDFMHGRAGTEHKEYG